MAVQDYELLLRVRADLLEAINGLKGLTNEIGEGDAATRKLGESADQATDRIRAMVQASKEQADVQARVAESMRSVNERAAAPGIAPAGSSADVAAEAAAFNAAVAAKRAALQSLDAAFAENIATAEGAAAAESALDEAMASGAITAKEQAAYLKKLDAAKAEDVAVTEASTAAVTENTVAMGVNAGTARELGVVLGELARGNTARLEGSMVTLASRTGLLTLLFNPLTLAIGAVVAAMGAFVLGAERTAEEQNQFNKVLDQTGDYAGTTAADMEQLAGQIAGSNARLGDARVILTTLAATGKVSRQSLASLGQAAMDMAQLTGESADKAATAVVGIFDGTTASLLKANNQYHFLTSSIYDQIKALEDEGSTQAAMDVAAQAFHDAAAQRIEQEKESVRGLARVWDSVKEAIQGAWQQTKTAASIIVRTADDQTRLYALEGRKAQAQENTKANGDYTLGQTLLNAVGLGYSQNDDKEIERLKAKIKADTDQAELQGFNTQLSTGAVNADAELDKLGQRLDKTSAKQAALNNLNEQFLAIWKGNDPDKPDSRLAGVQAITGDDGQTTFSGGLYDQLKADIEKHYHGPKVKNTANALATSQQQLQQQILSLGQNALGPVSGIWNKYTQAMLAAAAAGAKAIKTIKAGGDVAAIQSQVDKIQTLAAQARDQALAEQRRGLELSYAQATGDQATAAKLQIEQQYGELLADLQRRGDTAGVQLVNRLINVSQANAQLQQLQQQVSQVLDDESRKEQTYQAEQQAGLLTEIDARQKIIDLHRATADEVGKLIPQMQALAAATGDPTTIQRVKDLQAQVQDLQLTTSIWQSTLQQGLQSGLGKVYDDLEQRTTDLRGMVLDFVGAVADSFAQLALQNLAQKATSGIAGLFGQAPDAGNAAAITVAGTTAATSMGTAITSAGLIAAQAMATAIAAASAAATLSTGTSAAIQAGGSIGGSWVSAAAGLPALFDEGGYTGPGSKHQVAGLVHAGEVVHRSEVVRQPGALPLLLDINRRGMAAVHDYAAHLYGYANGGLVHPLANVPAPSLPAPARPRLSPPTDAGGGSSRRLQQRIVIVDDPGRIPAALKGPVGEESFMYHLSRNTTEIRHRLGID